MVRVVIQPRVIHPVDLFVVAQVLGNRERIVAVAIHSHWQGFDSLQDQKTIEWGYCRAHVTQRYNPCTTDKGRLAQRFGIYHTMVGRIRLVELGKPGVVFPWKLA